MTTYNQEMAQSFNALGIDGTTDQWAFSEFEEMVGGSLKGKTVFELGIGGGRSTEFLYRFNPRLLVGAERDKDMLEEAKRGKHKDSEYVRATGSERHLPFRDNSFDAVFSSYVPCETPDRESLVHIFNELNRVLKPGGDCYIITLNPEAILSGADFVTYHYDKELKLKDGDPFTSYIHSDPPAQFPDTFWTLNTLRDAFKECGFDILAEKFPKAVGRGWRDETRVAPDYLVHLIP